MDRRSELAEGALAYVLDHGLIALSLRPLAAALGTSDRMLIYHFGSKETLIADVIALANRRLADSLGEPDPPVHTVAELVRYAWRALAADGNSAMRLYLELCVLSVGEPERYRAAHEHLREPWLVMLRSGLAELDVPPPRVPALADLLLDTIDGLLLDRLVTSDPTRVDAAAEAFADLLEHAGGRCGGVVMEDQERPEGIGSVDPDQVTVVAERRSRTARPVSQPGQRLRP